MAVVEVALMTLGDTLGDDGGVTALGELIAFRLVAGGLIVAPGGLSPGVVTGVLLGDDLDGEVDVVLGALIKVVVVLGVVGLPLGTVSTGVGLTRSLVVVGIVVAVFVAGGVPELSCRDMSVVLGGVVVTVFLLIEPGVPGVGPDLVPLGG